MDDWKDLQGNSVSEFIKAYRDSLQAQRDASRKLLEQQRKQAQTSIMSSANTAGAMYSNFPTRDKIKYDTQTYMPAYAKTQSSYQTALDSLRNNAVNLWNNIRAYQEQINDYDAM